MQTLDTRDLYKRKCKLEGLRDTLTSAGEELAEHLKNKPEEEGELEAWEDELADFEAAVESAKSEFGPDEKTELEELEELENEISEFMHGETMVPVNSFQEYAQELAEEIGAIPDGSKWPLTCIDWEQAAKELATDYTQVSYQGEDYYVRS